MVIAIPIRNMISPKKTLIRESRKVPKGPKASPRELMTFPKNLKGASRTFLP